MKLFLPTLTYVKFIHCLLIAGGLLCGLGLSTVGVKAQQLPQSPDAPGVITGIVNNSAGEPLANITVSLYREGEGPFRTVMTDANGVYRFGLLAAGIYQLAFHEPKEQYALQFYGGAPILATASDLVVAGQVVTVTPVSLVAGSQITGTITNLTNAPLGQITMRAYLKVQNQWHLVVEKWLNADVQSYSLGGLPAGVFHLCVGTDTVAKCYPDLGTTRPIPENREDAEDIVLTVGEQRTQVDFVLGNTPSRGEISGRVTNVAGAPLERISVEAYVMSAGSPPAFTLTMIARTDANGDYQLPNLSPGQYVLGFRDNEKHLYLDQAYAQADSLRAARPIAIAAGSQVGSINVVMAMGGVVTGQVRVAGAVVTPTRLWLYRQSADGWREHDFAWTHTDSGYRVTGLTTGLYRVEGEVNLDGIGYYRGYHGGLAQEGAATLQVTAGTTLTQNLDLFLAPDLFAGVISGTVRSAGQPLAAIQVEAISATNNRVLVHATSDQQGRYQIAGLPDDQYYLRFSDPAGLYAFSWYRKPLSPIDEQPRHKEEGTMVSIKGTTIAPGIDGTLAQAGAIQGQVRWATGEPAVGLAVYLFAATTSIDWQLPACYAIDHCAPTITTDQQGRYQLAGLPPGRYHVGFFPYVDEHNGRAYQLREALATSNDVMVQAGTTTSEIDSTIGPLNRVFLPFVSR